MNEWIIRCRVSGGVTGTREATLKANGTVQYFASLEAAAGKAADLMLQMNHKHSVANFEYWPVPAEEGYRS